MRVMTVSVYSLLFSYLKKIILISFPISGNYFHALSFDMEPLGKNARKDDISMDAPGSTPLHKSEHIYRQG